MAIIHVVLFKFKPDTPAETVSEIEKRFLALQEECLHPVSNSPYIKSLKGGRDNSPEGHQNGFTHCFVAEMESAEDRAFYLEKDPAHLSLLKLAGPHIAAVQVNDFTPNVF